MTKPLALFKIGGDVLLSEDQYQGLAENLHDLREAGWNVIILHGGGPQVNALQDSLGIKPNKVAGRRITSESDLNQVLQAIAGEVNVKLTNILLNHDIPALGTHGASNIIHAKKRPPIAVSGVEGLVDFGSVGDVCDINAQLLFDLIDIDLVPVIATLARDKQGNLFNINADTTAVAIAKALQVDILAMITAVGGIYRDIEDSNSLINTIDRETAEKLIEEQVITDGMIPKVQEALSVVDHGVGQVLITSLSRKGNMKSLLRNSNDYNLGTRIITH